MLVEKIKLVFEKSRKVYGSPRITEILRKDGVMISKSYVARLMKEMGLRSVIRKKFVVTTDSKHDDPIAPNTLDREFEVDELGKVWVSDITYIRMNSEWVYLTTIIDLADRMVVGWSISKDMTAENTVQKAWSHARRRRQIKDGFIFHSDRGIQYTCLSTRNLFTFNIKASQSMSRKGNCWDNAVAESFFKSIKAECLNLYKFTSYRQVAGCVNDYMEWYNCERIHSSLGYKTPLEKEIELRSKLKNVA